MPHKINCELTDEQLGLLCEVLSERHHKLYLRTLDVKSCMLKYKEDINPHGSWMFNLAEGDAHMQLNICSSLISELESKL